MNIQQETIAMERKTDRENSRLIQHRKMIYHFLMVKSTRLVFSIIGLYKCSRASIEFQTATKLSRLNKIPSNYVFHITYAHYAVYLLFHFFLYTGFCWPCTVLEIWSSFSRIELFRHIKGMKQISGIWPVNYWLDVSNLLWYVFSYVVVHHFKYLFSVKYFSIFRVSFLHFSSPHSLVFFCFVSSIFLCSIFWRTLLFSYLEWLIAFWW